MTAIRKRVVGMADNPKCQVTLELCLKEVWLKLGHIKRKPRRYVATSCLLGWNGGKRSRGS
jgi:hypothetical protein